MFQSIEYIKFLLTSTNQHGVHSPFVYDLVTKCFYDKTQYEAYSKLSDYRASLLNNKQSIKITDFGSGSKVFNSNLRAINAIAKTSGSSLKRAQLLFRLVNYLKPKHILELGTSLGLATQAMALGNSESDVISVEGCPNCSEFAKQQLSKDNLKNVTTRTGEFDTIIPNLKEKSYDLVFFDGNHSKEATLHYFDLLIDKSHNDSLFIFDDIYWSRDMLQAWEQIILNPRVTVSIDTFFWGFVFFRKEQTKENFKLRL